MLQTRFTLEQCNEEDGGGPPTDLQGLLWCLLRGQTEVLEGILSSFPVCCCRCHKTTQVNLSPRGLTYGHQIVMEALGPTATLGIENSLVFLIVQSASDSFTLPGL